MKTTTSCFAKFDVQRNSLAEFLVALCKDRCVDTNIAKPIINAIDILDSQSFDKIQSSTLKRFPKLGVTILTLIFVNILRKP